MSSLVCMCCCPLDSVGSRPTTDADLENAVFFKGRGFYIVSGIFSFDIDLSVLVLVFYQRKSLRYRRHLLGFLFLPIYGWLRKRYPNGHHRPPYCMHTTSTGVGVTDGIRKQLSRDGGYDKGLADI